MPYISVIAAGERKDYACEQVKNKGVLWWKLCFDREMIQFEGRVITKRYGTIENIYLSLVKIML